MLFSVLFCFFKSCFIKPVEPEIFFFTPLSISLSLSLSLSLSPPFLSLIIKAFPIHFQIKVGMVKDVVSLRSAGNLHDKASSPPPPPPLLLLLLPPLRFMSKGGEGRGANVNGRSNVNYLYASLSGAEQTRDWRLPAPSSRQITMKFSDQMRSFRGLNRQNKIKNKKGGDAVRLRWAAHVSVC